MIASLTKIEREAWLPTLPAWRYDAQRNALYRRLELPDFSTALALMVKIGFAAEKLNHHPEWTNIYNCLDIWLTTHDADGISIRDVELAAVIDRIAETYDQ